MPDVLKQVPIQEMSQSDMSKENADMDMLEPRELVILGEVGCSEVVAEEAMDVVNKGKRDPVEKKVASSVDQSGSLSSEFIPVKSKSSRSVKRRSLQWRRARGGWMMRVRSFFILRDF